MSIQNTITPLDFSTSYQHFLDSSNNVKPIEKGASVPDVKLFIPNSNNNINGLEELSSRNELNGDVLAITVPSVLDPQFEDFFPELLNHIKELKNLGWRKMVLISKDIFQTLNEWQQKNSLIFSLKILSDPKLSLITRLGICQNTDLYGLTSKYSLIFIKSCQIENISVYNRSENESAENLKIFLKATIEKIKNISDIPFVHNTPNRTNTINQNNHNNNNAFDDKEPVSSKKRTRSSFKTNTNVDLEKLDGLNNKKRSKLKISIPDEDQSSNINTFAIEIRSKLYLKKIEEANNNENNFYNHSDSGKLNINNNQPSQESYETIIYSDADTDEEI
jgi:peroxiredoxin